MSDAKQNELAASHGSTVCGLTLMRDGVFQLAAGVFMIPIFVIGGVIYGLSIGVRTWWANLTTRSAWRGEWDTDAIRYSRRSTQSN